MFCILALRTTPAIRSHPASKELARRASPRPSVSETSGRGEVFFSETRYARNGQNKPVVRYERVVRRIWNVPQRTRSSRMPRALSSPSRTWNAKQRLARTRAHTHDERSNDSPVPMQA